jgi:large subunit ribosomal protein L15
MKLHDLQPADGSRMPRRRVGRGIAAGQGKTAGRGTKGQKARTGGSIPPWFEGGQTPLHMRIPKLRGFRNRLKIGYEVVNIGRIGELAGLGAFEAGETPGSGGKKSPPAPITINQEILRAVGLVRTLDRPMKVLGQGEVEVPLFVVADAFSKSAVAKIEAAGGSVQVLQIPTGPMPALALEPTPEPAPEPQAEPRSAAVAERGAVVEAGASKPGRAARPKTAEPKAARAKRAGAPGEGGDRPSTDDAPAGEDA